MKKLAFFLQISLTLPLISNAMDIACVSQAFITCSLKKSQSPITTEEEQNYNDDAYDGSEFETTGGGGGLVTYQPVVNKEQKINELQMAEDDDDYVRCPHQVYECLKSHEKACPMVNKFLTNLQAVCEPERRRFIAEFQMCSQSVEVECGTGMDEADDDLQYQVGIDEVARQRLMDVKCQRLQLRHKCAHEVFTRERCSNEAVNYFENQILAEMKEANLSTEACRITLKSYEHSQSDDPKSASWRSDKSSASPLSQDQYSSEATNALKRELKSNPLDKMSSAFSQASQATLSTSLLLLAFSFLLCHFL